MCGFKSRQGFKSGGLIKLPIVLVDFNYSFRWKNCSSLRTKINVTCLKYGDKHFPIGWLSEFRNVNECMAKLE